MLILDNYVIHKSQVTQRWLAKNPKFRLLFQPTYCPWVNVIERLWKAMHDTVTRNHRCRSMYELCQSVARFLEVAPAIPRQRTWCSTFKISYLAPLWETHFALNEFRGGRVEIL